MKNYNNETLDINFIASDKVVQNNNLYNIYKSIYTQNLITFVGVNATGKTKTLKIIEFILKILIDKYGLNDFFTVPYGVDDKTEFWIYFIDNKKVYEWNFIIHSVIENGKQKLSFYDEIIKSKYITSVTSRKDIFDFSSNKIKDIEKRSELPASIKEMMKEDSSITIKIDKFNETRVFSLISVTNINIMLPTGNVPENIINLFDHSIENLNCNSNGCLIKFKNESYTHNLKNFSEISNYLSSGTIKGNYVFLNAIKALITGGYFIIDEIENHFHKELVKLLIDLFKSSKTNPYGATIIFSTHYAEILDVVDRKDNIYLLKKKDNKIECLNYSNFIERNDLKKSEVLLSGIIDGTAPKYEDIKNFKEFICRNLSGKE